jgi:hypothetical protein
MKSRPSEKYGFISQPGGINLLMRLLKISFDETSPFDSLIGTIIEVGVDIVTKSNSDLEICLAEACHLIRSTLETCDCSQKLLKKAIEILKLADSFQSGSWQDFFLKMMPEVKTGKPTGLSSEILFSEHPLCVLSDRESQEVKVFI